MLGTARHNMPHSEETKRKMRGNYLGKLNGKWKGDKVGYEGIHSWIARQLGKPEKCEHCGKDGDGRYEWCNKDHKYRRNTEDWMRLCPSCHRKYDRKNNKKS